MTAPNAMPRFITVDMLAEILAVDKRTIYRLVGQGLVPAPVKIGRSSRWPEDEVAAYVERLRKERQR